MLKFYTGRDVKAITERVAQEYELRMKNQREALLKLTEENRRLKAELSVFQQDKENISDAILRSESMAIKIKAEADCYAEKQKQAILIMSARCEKMVRELEKKYPEAEDLIAYTKFSEELKSALANDSEETELDMKEVLYPDKDLNLEKLCKDLGLMDDE